MTGTTTATARHRTRPVNRFAADTSRPTVGEFWHDLWRRAMVPAVGLLAVITGIGFLIIGPLDDLPAETAPVQWLAEHRVPALDTWTEIWSFIGGTEFIIGGSILVFVITVWATREWWYGIIPGVAVFLQAAVFMISAAVVGRERPEVDKLDDAPPTSSFPSGHTGASTAFWVTTALVAQRIRITWLRVVVTVVTLAVPLLVAFSRLYRGMHHPTDVFFGAVNGLVCVWLAWYFLRRQPAPAEQPG